MSPCLALPTLKPHLARSGVALQTDKAKIFFFLRVTVLLCMLFLLGFGLLACFQCVFCQFSLNFCWLSLNFCFLPLQSLLFGGVCQDGRFAFFPTVCFRYLPWSCSGVRSNSLRWELRLHWRNCSRSRSPSMHWRNCRRSRTPSLHWRNCRRGRSPSLHWRNCSRSRSPSLHWRNCRRSRTPSLHWRNCSRSRSPSLHWRNCRRSRTPSLHWRNCRRSRLLKKQFAEIQRDTWLLKYVLYQTTDLPFIKKKF